MRRASRRFCAVPEAARSPSEADESGSWVSDLGPALESEAMLAGNGRRATLCSLASCVRDGAAAGAAAAAATAVLCAAWRLPTPAPSDDRGAPAVELDVIRTGAACVCRGASCVGCVVPDAWRRVVRFGVMSSSSAAASSAVSPRPSSRSFVGTTDAAACTDVDKGVGTGRTGAAEEATCAAASLC